MTIKRAYGPVKPSRLALMGIRFIEGEGGAAPAAPATPEPKPAEPAQDPTDWKAASRKWEDRAKENAAAAQRLEEIEESNKTELQKANDRAAAAEKVAAQAVSDSLRLKVANAKGIPEDLLSGSTQEELEASADKLIAFRGEQPNPEPVPEPAPEKKTYFIPDEGGIPAIGKADNITPGMGSLRAGYAEASERK